MELMAASKIRSRRYNNSPCIVTNPPDVNNTASHKTPDVAKRTYVRQDIISTKISRQMLRPRGFASRLLTRPQTCHRRLFSDDAQGTGNAYADASSTLAPSKLLRYLLNDNPTKTAEADLDNDPISLLKYQNLNAISKRELLSPDGSLLYREPPTDLHKVSNLHDLQSWFEQYAAAGYTTSSDPDSLRDALINCERFHSSQEIVSVLNAFVTRHRINGMTVPEIVHIAGLYYAAQSFLPYALSFHLRSLSSPLQETETDRIIKCLLNASRTHRLADSAYDPNLMLGIVAGEGSQAKDFEKKLVDALRLRDGSFSIMIELLLELGAKMSLRNVWNSLIGRLLNKTTSTLIDDAYTCIMVFLKANKVDRAKVCLRDLEEMINNKHYAYLSLRVSSQLVTILDAHGLAVPRGVRNRIRQAKDQPSNKDGDARWAESLQMDGETIDFSSVQSLITQIREYGNSLSVSEIGIVIDALGDFEGSPIPLFTQRLDNGLLEFAWFPQWTPVATQSESNATNGSILGLLRARIEFRNILVSPERCRNVVQLGYLAQREILSANLNGSPEQDDAGGWMKTGYLVAFDRVSSEFLLIFMGDNSSLFGSAYQSPAENSSKEAFKQNPLIGSLSTLVMPTNSQDLKRDIKGVALPVKNAAPRYVFDIDPGWNLTS